jgi:20S proteasome alpha/beta subunit
MTLIVGLRCGDSAVLASDSQGTYGSLKKTTPKLFRSDAGIVWGTAGPLAAAQTLYTKLESLGLDQNPGREAAKAGIKQAMLATADDMRTPGTGELAGGSFAGLFVWYAEREERAYLLRVHSNGDAEFERQYGAVGSSKQLAEFGFLGFNRSEYLDYNSLPLEAAKMLVHSVANDAVRASAQGVAAPIQLGVVTASEAAILEEKDLQPVRDTASAFRMYQADYLVRADDGDGGVGDSGLVPGENDS